MNINDIAVLARELGGPATIGLIVVYFLMKQSPVVKDGDSKGGFSSDDKLYLHEKVVQPIVDAIEKK